MGGQIGVYMSEIGVFLQKCGIADARIPYKILRKPMILGARFSLETQKSHTAALPYKTCRICMVPLTKSFS